MGDRLGAVGRDDDALAGGQPVVFDDVGRTELVQRGGDLLRTRAEATARRRHVRGSHHLLGERLAALQLRRRGGRAEAVDAGRPNGIGDTRDERSLGADHYEIGRELCPQRRDGGAVDRIDTALLGHGGGAGVPWGARQRGDARIGRTAPGRARAHGHRIR